ncbi:hypothetical protein DFS34DRAFT_27917 [Phlyctochytrium arcticum]|nr:hypothetical protein DFS34DRAFT_27917 [Phlyctochytrium arcticum]
MLTFSSFITSINWLIVLVRGHRPHRTSETTGSASKTLVAPKKAFLFSNFRCSLPIRQNKAFQNLPLYKSVTLKSWHRFHTVYASTTVSIEHSRQVYSGAYLRGSREISYLALLLPERWTASVMV